MALKSNPPRPACGRHAGRPFAAWLRLGVFAACPAELRVYPPEAFAPSLLCAPYSFFFFLLAKTPSRKEILVHSCPPRRTSLTIRKWGNSPLTRGLGGFILAKPIYPPPRTSSWRLSYFARPIPFFFFILAKPSAAGRTQRRKEIVVHSVRLSAAADWLGGFAACPAELRVYPPEAFAAWRLCELFLFSSRKGAKPQRNTGRPTAGRLTEKKKYPFFAPSLLC